MTAINTVAVTVSFHFNWEDDMHGFTFAHYLFLAIVYISAFGVLMDMEGDA